MGHIPDGPDNSLEGFSRHGDTVGSRRLVSRVSGISSVIDTVSTGCQDCLFRLELFPFGRRVHRRRTDAVPGGVEATFVIETVADFIRGEGGVEHVSKMVRKLGNVGSLGLFVLPYILPIDSTRVSNNINLVLTL